MRMIIPAAFALMTAPALAQSPNGDPQLNCTICEDTYGEDFS